MLGFQSHNLEKDFQLFWASSKCSISKGAVLSTNKELKETVKIVISTTDSNVCDFLYEMEQSFENGEECAIYAADNDGVCSDSGVLGNAPLKFFEYSADKLGDTDFIVIEAGI